MEAIFAHCRIYITRNIFSGRAALLKKIITKHGGCVVSTVENATHIIFCEELHEKKKSLQCVSNLINVTSNDVLLLSAAWVCDSVKAKTRLSPDPFLFKPEMPNVDNTTGPPAEHGSDNLLDIILCILVQVPPVSNKLEEETYELTTNGYKLNDDAWLRRMASLGGFFATGVVPKYE